MASSSTQPLTVYTYINHHSTLSKILVTAAYNDVTIVVEDKENAPESIKSHPLSAVRTFDSRWPVLLTSDGPIFQSNAIARYVSKLGNHHDHLLGSSALEEGQINQWIDYSSNEVFLPVIAYVYPLLGYVETTQQEKELSKAAALKVAEFLDSYFLDNTFLVGNHVTLADIVLSTTILDLYVHVFDDDLAAKYGNLTRWFSTLIHQDPFHTVLGTTVFLAQSLATHHEVSPAARPSESPSASPSGTRRASGALFRTARERVTQEVIAALAARPYVEKGKRLSEKDLLGKGMPSTFHAPSATKDRPVKHQTAVNVVKGNIQQPK